jgi:hypothetical protein
MKNSKISFVLFALFALSMTFTSCGNKTNQVSDQKGKEYTSAFICPMHCEGSGSDQAGKCPVCGMDYVKNPAHTYACPMHPEVTGVKGDKCSKCGMDLTEMTGEDHSGHSH